METKHNICFVFTVIVIMASGCDGRHYGQPVSQVSIDRIELMPNMPSPYKMLDWEQKAKDFDAYIFDEQTRIFGNPMIWYDNSRRNIDQETFGLYTAVNDCRQGSQHNNGEFHESLNSLTALIGGTLVGVDKTNQNGHNYVKMVQNYFNCDNGWNIIMNNTCPDVAGLGGGYGRDWWYDVFPNVLYYALCDLYPNVDGALEIQKSVAEQFRLADEVLGGDYGYSYFDYSEMCGMTNNIPLQQDAAGGHAYVLYAAYKIFNEPAYLERAKSAIESLLACDESCFYEILLPIGVITAARLNAEQGTDYDVKKLIDWTFDGCRDIQKRYGWGVIAERWGDYDVYGLQGNITDGGGYAFFMNSVKLAWPLVPTVKYEPQFARAIGKWLLNLANACRLFYPTEIDDAHQWLPELKYITGGNIAYEGLRKHDQYGKQELDGVCPVALGDGPQWAEGNPPESMFSVYSTAPVGILGSIIRPTNVEGILRADCNATDFYADRPFPVYMYYNPFLEDKTICYETTSQVDLFDIVSKKYIAKGVNGEADIVLPADNSVVIMEIPARTGLHAKGGKIITDNDITISYK